ncbi:Rho-GTPase-activating protein 8 [Dimargaris cristalligena]|nr:Rho-GTPase-activating protein 8 [Dimargaris cristalligena]
MLKFENSFWGNLATGPDHRVGLEPLQRKMDQGLVELGEVLDFFTERVAIEKAYAQQLQNIGERAFRADGFRRDDGASLRMVFEAIQREHLTKAATHLRFVQDLVEWVVTPLTQFRDQHADRLQTNHEAIHQEVRHYLHHRRRADNLGRIYRAQCARANWAQTTTEKTQSATYAAHQQIQVVSHVLGPLSFTKLEFVRFFERVQASLPTHDVKYGLLGTFRGLISGEEFVAWVRTNYPSQVRSVADAEAVGQSLMGQNFLRYIGRGSTFTARSGTYYQWKRHARELMQITPPSTAGLTNPTSLFSDSLGGREDGLINPLSPHDWATADTRSILSDDFDAHSINSNTDPSSYLAELSQRASMDSFDLDEDALQAHSLRTRQLADSADNQYRLAVRKTDHCRMGVEAQLFSYLDSLQIWETDRLLNIQSALGHFVRVLSPLMNADAKNHYENIVVSCESFKPDQDLQFIIEQNGTGSYCPQPCVYVNQYRGAAEYQVFGLALEDQMRVSTRPVPLFIAKTLSALHKATFPLDVATRLDSWSTEVNISAVHALRQEINYSGKVTLKQLRHFEPPILVGALRLYLLELPECLLTFELYDATRALYQTQRGGMDPTDHLTCIRQLLRGLSPVHLATLRAIIEPIHRLYVDVMATNDSVTAAENTKRMDGLLQRFGSAMLRLRKESNVNFHDRHSTKFMRDLVRLCPDIFHRLESLNGHAGTKVVNVDPRYHNMPKSRFTSKPGLGQHHGHHAPNNHTYGHPRDYLPSLRYPGTRSDPHPPHFTGSGRLHPHDNPPQGPHPHSPPTRGGSGGPSPSSSSTDVLAQFRPVGLQRQLTAPARTWSSIPQIQNILPRIPSSVSLQELPQQDQYDQSDSNHHHRSGQTKNQHHHNHRHSYGHHYSANPSDLPAMLTPTSVSTTPLRPSFERDLQEISSLIAQVPPKAAKASQTSSSLPPPPNPLVAATVSSSALKKSISQDSGWTPAHDHGVVPATPSSPDRSESLNRPILQVRDAGDSDDDLDPFFRD